MLKEKVGLPPFPPHWRIPNFKGARKAASMLSTLPEWLNSSVLKINPDSPQKTVRHLALLHGKDVVMPTPRIKNGFLLLIPREIPEKFIKEASTIKGAFKWGMHLYTVESIKQKVPRIDMIVEGSVAVDYHGNRLGKGEGYGELEFAILREAGVLEDNVPIATTVHDIQVLSNSIPRDEFDVPLDIIVTPTRIIRVKNRDKRPTEIIWPKLSKQKINSIPILHELWSDDA